jgi:uncharacterized surface protein with fasciclin (FAS1) repeats
MQRKSPFTVFAPTNDAFSKLPARTMEELMKATRRVALIRLLTYTVVAGPFSTRDLHPLVREHGGTFRLQALTAGWLMVIQDGPASLSLRDQQTKQCRITIADIYQLNGSVHEVDTVPVP